MLLLLGACGKSAQIPLYIWLPDAMAGPTPVSALIHAATMVTAGVYMTARSAVFFTHAPIAMDWVAVIGLATAFIAATIGLAQTDIKKVFAYSTVSQLGYMFLGLGVGAFSAGVFHLMTHAFFKALLFLGAGAVIHGLHGEQDLRQMGGLFKHMKITALTLLCASFAISGFPFTSGFFSKDAILVAAYARAPWMYWVGVLTAGMTAFYVFRAWFLAFTGDYRGHAHPHESPLVMTGPLMILAVLSLVGGFINIPHWLEPMFAEKPENQSLAWISAGVGVAGILLAYVFYVAKRGLADSFVKAMNGFYTLVFNKYYVDEIYNALVVRPLMHYFARRSLEGRRCRLDRWHGERRGHAIARHRRHFAAAAIRKYSYLCSLGGAGIHRGADRNRVRRRPPMTLLDLVIFLPLAAFLLILFLPKEHEEGIRRFSLIASLAVFVSSLGLLAPYWFSNPGKYVFETDMQWVTSPNIHYHVAIDGISLWLVLLTTLLTPHLRVGVLEVRPESGEGILRFPAAARIRIDRRVLLVRPVPVLCFLGSFAGSHVLPDRRLGPRTPHLRRREILPVHHGGISADAGGHHLSLQPGWNVRLRENPRRIANGSIASTYQEQLLLFLAFFIAFAIKVPIFPLHTWLPDAHVEAPRPVP